MVSEEAADAVLRRAGHDPDGSAPVGQQRHGPIERRPVDGVERAVDVVGLTARRRGEHVLHIGLADALGRRAEVVVEAGADVGLQPDPPVVPEASGQPHDRGAAGVRTPAQLRNRAERRQRGIGQDQLRHPALGGGERIGLGGDPGRKVGHGTDGTVIAFGATAIAPRRDKGRATDGHVPLDEPGPTVGGRHRAPVARRGRRRRRGAARDRRPAGVGSSSGPRAGGGHRGRRGDPHRPQGRAGGARRAARRGRSGSRAGARCRRRSTWPPSSPVRAGRRGATSSRPRCGTRSRGPPGSRSASSG